MSIKVFLKPIMKSWNKLKHKFKLVNQYTQLKFPLSLTILLEVRSLPPPGSPTCSPAGTRWRPGRWCPPCQPGWSRCTPCCSCTLPGSQGWRSRHWSPLGCRRTCPQLSIKSTHARGEPGSKRKRKTLLWGLADKHIHASQCPVTSRGVVGDFFLWGYAIKYYKY